MNHFTAFKQGAFYMATRTPEQMQEMGMNLNEYAILTQDAAWLPSEVQQMRGVLAHAINVSLTFAHLPARALPAQYVAAVIAYVVKPVNWLTAATIAPETFDALGAANADDNFVVKPFRYEQMISLVMMYGAGSDYQKQDQIIRDPVELERTEK